MNLLRALQAKSGPVGSWFHTIKEIDFIFRCCARLVRIQLIKRCEIRYRIKILPENFFFFKDFRLKGKVNMEITFGKHTLRTKL